MISKTKIKKRSQRKDNPQLRELIIKMKKQKDPLWIEAARQLVRPRRQNHGVSIFKINQATSDGDTVLIPGKVIASGKLEKKIKIAAFNFSQGARQQIIASGGEVLKIEDLLKENPKTIKLVK